MKIIFPSSRTDSDRAGLDTHRFDAPIFRATTPAATRTARFGRDRASSHWRGRSAFRPPSESPNAFSGSRYPRRSPGTDRGCIGQRQSTDATGVADSTRSRRYGKEASARRPPTKHRQDGRRKTSARQAADGTRITGSAEDAPARRGHWQRGATGGPSH